MVATYHPYGVSHIQKSVFTRDYRIFVRLLRKLRQDASLSQEEVATRLGETQSFIGKCERGERRLDIVELQEFCRALNIALPEFVRQLEEAQQLSNDQLRNYLGEMWP